MNNQLKLNKKQAFLANKFCMLYGVAQTIVDVRKISAIVWDIHEEEFVIVEVEDGYSGSEDYAFIVNVIPSHQSAELCIANAQKNNNLIIMMLDAIKGK